MDCLLYSVSVVTNEQVVETVKEEGSGGSIVISFVEYSICLVNLQVRIAVLVLQRVSSRLWRTNPSYKFINYPYYPTNEGKFSTLSVPQPAGASILSGPSPC